MRAEASFNSSRVASEELSVQFGEFCKFTDGLVLDVGSGRNKAPYLSRCGRPVALDPLVPENRDFEFVRGVGEFLPFRIGVFAGSVTATTLDHCMKPSLVLREMRRVTMPDGRICIWIGLHDKILRPPKPVWTLSKGWRRLVSGDLAYIARAIYVRYIARYLKTQTDPFHLHHFQSTDIAALLDTAGLTLVEEKLLPDGSLFLSAKCQETNAL